MKLSKIHKQIYAVYYQYLMIAFVVSLMIPVFILVFTEKNSFWISVACVMISLGGYTLFAALFRRSGVMVWLGLPLIFLSAFQIVISYLFGNSVVAADMFLNLLTTNVGEAGELLSNLYPAIVSVVLIYLPLLWVATMHIYRGVVLPNRQRWRMLGVGGVALLVGCGMLMCGSSRSVEDVVRNELFPINGIYNMGIAVSEAFNISDYFELSKNFEYKATRYAAPSCKEVYVLVIGEASRASSWQAYGYERSTTPLLAAREDIVWFRNVLTQSNTTHKSVPMMLSSVHPLQHRELYHRTGIISLFDEVGFATYFISSQAPQGAMIDNLASEAQHVEYVNEPCRDMQLVDAVCRVLSEEIADKIFIVLHTYGSHFSYHQRYPREFARFTPDDEVAINDNNVDLLRNAYDNSICYTDYFLNQVISTLDELKDVSTAMFYCADHGEDLFDGGKQRFLHSSPMVTYHQLHVASLAWFSDTYNREYSHKVGAARKNMTAPASTFSVFHTMADMANITSPYIVDRASLLSHDFDSRAERYYLNDHNRAVKLNAEIGINHDERKLFYKHGIQL